ncbi:MAG: hypothetical protein FWC20_06365, partial [Oscillospiraceae bacterium]|nr:hypothetical protein [Oscillospiraceae bacterium]
IKTLKNIKPAAFKDVTLVIDGSFIYTRKINIPGKLPQKMYRRLIRDEFSDVATDIPNLICDYIHLKTQTGENTTKEILAFGIENANAMSYIALFHAAGVELSRVHIGVYTLLYYISQQKDHKETAFVLNAVDEEQMLSIIFSNKTSIFQQRTRLFPDATGSSAQSILDGLFGIISFNRSQNFPEITHSYYLGVSDAEVSAVSSRGDYPEIHFSALDLSTKTHGADKLPPDAYFTFLNAIMPDSETDLLHSMKMQKKEKKQDRPKNRYIPIAATFILLLALTVAFLLFRVHMVENDIADIHDFLYSQETVESRYEIEILNAETAQTSALYGVANNQIQNTEALPQVSKELISTIERVGRPSISILSLSFNSNNGILSVSSSAHDLHDASSFVERLRRETIIAEVYYTGYRITPAEEFVFTIEVVKNNWRAEVSD